MKKQYSIEVNGRHVLSVFAEDAVVHNHTDKNGTLTYKVLMLGGQVVAVFWPEDGVELTEAYL